MLMHLKKWLYRVSEGTPTDPVYLWFEVDGIIHLRYSRSANEYAALVDWYWHSFSKAPSTRKAA